MAPYTKPEAVLKQAEGLLSVGQQSAALQSLTEMFSSKRFRSTPITSLEPIVMRFLELCVDLRKGRTAKEGLMQFKNVAQNTSVASVEIVVKKFIQLADAKVQEAQEKADQLAAVDDVDDLEATETPENVLLSAVSGDQNKDRTDRAVVTPWLKFLWESYRTVLETLKNNARLEAIYQQIAAAAFKFCLKHTRKVEFRRLCETLRLHLGNVAKYVNQTHSINLADPDTLQRHLDTRFAQLNTSVELELWQEAFRSVEDIHNLLTMAKKAPRPAMMANYYEKLTKIFLTSGNALFHAAAWARYYSVLRAAGGGGKTEEEMSRLAGQVLVSALAVPVGVESEEESAASRRNNARLTALLGLSKAPTRSGLLKEALARNTLKLSPASVRSLHNLLEVTFQPLTLCASIAPIVAELAQDPSYAPYLPLVHRAVLSRLFTQLSEVYSSVRIAHIFELVSPLNANITPETPGLNTESPYTPERIELFVMGCAKRGELRVLIEHIEGNITFVEDTLPRTRVSELANALHTTLLKISPPPAVDAQEKFAALVAGAQEDRRRLLIQRAVVARRRELVSELQVRREREEASRRADTARKERVEEEQRAALERRAREMARVQREIENVRREEARKLADQLKAKGNLKVAEEELEGMDTTKLIQLQVSQIDREKKELTDKLRIISKRVDHTERALRKAELPLLAEDYERQKADDKAAHEASAVATVSTAEQAHREAVEAKHRLSRMMDDYNARRVAINGQREEELQKKKAEMKVKIDKAKAARREKVLKEREEERLAEEAQRKEEEAREAEEARLEEEQRQAEEAQRAEEEAAAAAANAKREAQLELKRKEQEAALAKLKYEEEAEKRRAERRAQPSAATASPKPNGGEGGSAWRRTTAAPAAAANTPPSGSGSPAPAPASGAGGKWVPPARRAAEPPARTGSPAPRTPSVGAPASPSPAATPAGPAGGGWRARLAAKEAAGASGGSAPPTPTPAPTTPGEEPATPATPAQDDGFTTVQSTPKWRPSRGRGSGFGSAGRS